MPKRRLQISIRTALAILALVAIALGLWVNFRQTVVFSYSRCSSLPHFIVPEAFDRTRLDAILNSPEFSRELADENPEHRELIEARWDEIQACVEFQYVEPRSFQMQILFPAYTVQQRTLGWSGIETTTSRMGESKLATEVREKNESFKAELLAKIFAYVDEQADGEINVSRNFNEHIPKSPSNIWRTD